jgi:hypothetical protein
MQTILSGSRLWSNIRALAKKADQRKVAIAYVTKNLIGLRSGDVLIVDASQRTIRNGGTSAKLLRTLHRRGVEIYSCPDLHAKALLLDRVVVVGSANMSHSSAKLVEVALVSDSSNTIANVSSFIAQLEDQLDKLKCKQIDQLCGIKVERRGRGENFVKRITKILPLGHRTWMFGVHELARDPPASEQKLIDREMLLLRKQLGDPKLEPDWIQLGLKSRFAKKVRVGDSIIQVWRPNGVKQPKSVMANCPVLLKQRTKKWVRIFLGVPIKSRELSWANYKRLLKNLGYSRKMANWPEVALDDDLSASILRRWNSSK